MLWRNFTNPKRLNFQHSPLHIVAEHGSFRLFEFVYGRIGVKSLNALKEDGSTPLLFASYGGHFEICKFLIEKTEKKNPKRDDGVTPLHMAASKG